MRMLESKIPEHAGYIIEGKPVWNLKCAVDKTLIARSCDELQQQVSANIKIPDWPLGKSKSVL